MEPVSPNWFIEPEPLRWARRPGSSMHDIASGMAALTGAPNPFHTTIVPTFRCPSDPFVAPAGLDGLLCNYVGVYGPSCPFENCPGGVAATFRGNCTNAAWGLSGVGNERTAVSKKQVLGMFNWGGVILTMADISDGTTNTLLAGETLPGENARAIEMLPQQGWVDAKSWVNLGYTNIPINHFTPDLSPCDATNALQNANNYAVSQGFKSKHAGGANFAFCDGSVRFLSQFINQEVYTYLSWRNDGNVLPDF